jgi:putative ABC transport system permease protein
MIMAVRERTHEIGLRRALGARPRDIRVQFLIEAGLLAGGGGLAGMATGIGATYVAAALGGWEPVVSLPVAAMALAFSVTVGVIFGLVPAHRASRIAPIQALKAE